MISSATSIVLYEKVANLEFLFSGELRLRSKNRVVPCIGKLTKPQLCQVANNLSGRRARWAQLGLQDGPLLFAILFDILELLGAGYSNQNIRTAWKLQKRPGQDATFVNVIMKNESFTQTPLTKHGEHLLALAQGFQDRRLSHAPPTCSTSLPVQTPATMSWGQWGGRGGGRGGGGTGGGQWGHNGGSRNQNQF